MTKKRPNARVEDLSLNDRLLSAAVEVFLEKGLATASVDEIASRARASKITFYKHYGNKEALFEAVVRRENATLVKAVSAKVPDGMPLKEFLQAFADHLCAALLAKRTVRLVRMLQAETDRFPQLADIFNDSGPARGAKLLAAELGEYMDRGALRKADPNLAAEHFFHLTLGEVTRRLLLGLRPALSKDEISGRIAAGIDIFLQAYRP